MQTSVSTRFDQDTIERLDELSKGFGKSRSAIIKEAVENYLDYDLWYREEVQKGLDDVKRGRVISDEELMKTLRQLGYDGS